MKLMLVGRENVGKTSLRQCILAKNIEELYRMKKEKGVNRSTDGVEIEGEISMKFPFKNIYDIRLAS